MRAFLLFVRQAHLRRRLDKIRAKSILSQLRHDKTCSELHERPVLPGRFVLLGPKIYHI